MRVVVPVMSQAVEKFFGSSLGDASLAIASPSGKAALPVTDETFDVVVAGLALNWIPDPGAAVIEMERVVWPGGTVGAYVRDYAGEMQLVRTFWQAEVALDPAAAALERARQFPLCQPAPGQSKARSNSTPRAAKPGTLPIHGGHGRRFSRRWGVIGTGFKIPQLC